MDKRYFPQLTGLRFFAAFLVVWYHFGPINPGTALARLKNLTGDGGVSLFFMLSGFVLTINYRDFDGRFIASRRTYLLGRLARIYPQYVLAFILGAPGAISLTLMHGYAPLIETALIMIHAFAYLALLQAWTPPIAYSWIGPAWSLSCEAAFYVAFLFIRPPRLPRVGWWSAIAVASLTLAMVGAAASPTGSLAWHNFWFFFPALRIGEFVLGICAAQLVRLKALDPLLRHGDVAACMLVATVVLVGLICNQILFRLTTSLLFPFVIIALAVSNGWLCYVLSSKIMQILGKASFGMYILQFPVMNFFNFAMGRGLGDKVVGVFEFTTYSILLVAFSSLAFIIWEKPMERRMRCALENYFSGNR